MSDDPRPLDLDAYRPSTVRKTKVKGKPAEEDVEVEHIELTLESRTISHMSIEQLSERIIRRHANAILLNDEFLPGSLKEATEAAKGWAAIAAMTEARRKGQKNAGLIDPDPIVQAAVTQLESFRQEHRVKK